LTDRLTEPAVAFYVHVVRPGIGSGLFFQAAEATYGPGPVSQQSPKLRRPVTKDLVAYNPRRPWIDLLPRKQYRLIEIYIKITFEKPIRYPMAFNFRRFESSKKVR